MVCNYFLRLYEKQYCMFAIIVVIVKIMFRFWPRSPSSLNQSRNKALVRNLSAFTTLFAPDKSWDNMRSSAAPCTESRLTHLVRNKCVGLPVVEHFCTINIEIMTKHFFEQFLSINSKFFKSNSISATVAFYLPQRRKWGIRKNSLTLVNHYIPKKY